MPLTGKLRHQPEEADQALAPLAKIELDHADFDSGAIDHRMDRTERDQREPAAIQATEQAMPVVGRHGLPVHGICWYSRGDQYDWHTMLTRPVGEVTSVGLFDDRRHPRPVADAYAELARRHPSAA